MFADWLWGAYKKKVPETRFVLRQNDEELMQHAEKRNWECIVPSLRDAEGAPLSSRDTSDVLAQLAAGISRQNSATEMSNSLVREELERKKGKDEKKDRLSKLHPTFRNMLLNAASECGDRIAEAVPDSCQAFFDQETLGPRGAATAHSVPRIWLVGRGLCKRCGSSLTRRKIVVL